MYLFTLSAPHTYSASGPSHLQYGQHLSGRFHCLFFDFFPVISIDEQDLDLNGSISITNNLIFESQVESLRPRLRLGWGGVKVG